MLSSSQTTDDVQRTPLSLPGPANFIVASIVPTRNENPVHKNVKVMHVMGILEIVLGSISIILGIVTVTIVSNELLNPSIALPPIAASSQGLWCGIMVLIIGIMGIALKKHATRCLHIANMIFSFICSCIACAALINSMIMTFLSLLISVAVVGMHATLSVINFMILILTIVHSCFTCRGACYGHRSEGHRAMSYFPQHNAGFVQTNPDANYHFGEDLQGPLPYAEFIPRSPTVDNQTSNYESQPTTDVEPTNATGVVSHSRYTGYEAPNLSFISGEEVITPYATYTCYEQRNQTEREPAHTDRNPSTAHEKISVTPSIVSPVRDIVTVMNDDADYIEPNRVENRQVPDASSTDSNQASATSQSGPVESERDVSNTEDIFESD